MKILLAVPTFENIYPDTFKSLWELERDGHELIFEFIRGYDIATARNKIAQRAIELETDYVLMVDNDVVIPKDALKNLLQNNHDVCTGYYLRRSHAQKKDGATCVFQMREGGFKVTYDAEQLKTIRLNGQTQMQVRGNGFGCALIKTSVFNRLQFPYFDWVNYENKGLLSEDLYFCRKCAEANIPIYVDLRVQCGHMMRYVQWPDNI